jgi:hypothetical protein
MDRPAIFDGWAIRFSRSRASVFRPGLDFIEGLLEVGDQVFDVFDSDRYAHESVSDSDFVPDIRRD